jgi:hypothetical protein
MSWKIINQVIGLASINLAFRQALQQNPEAALREEGIELTPEELDTFRNFASLPFQLFCQRLEETLAPNEPLS